MQTILKIQSKSFKFINQIKFKKLLFQIFILNIDEFKFFLCIFIPLFCVNLSGLILQIDPKVLYYFVLCPQLIPRQSLKYFNLVKYIKHHLNGFSAIQNVMPSST